MDNQDPVMDNQDPDIVVDSGEVEKQEAKGWYSELGSDFANNPSITKFKDAKSLAKSYLELQKVIGKDKVVLPTEKSSPEEWREFYRKIGTPEGIDGYQVEDNDLPDEAKISDEGLAAFKEKALELGLTPKQFGELYNLQTELLRNSFNQHKESFEKMKSDSETGLRKEWGKAYDVKIDNAQKVINHFFKGKDINQAFEVLANDKGFIKAMAEIGESMGESVASGGSARMTLTPEEAQNEINQLVADTKGPLYDNLDPRHLSTKQRYFDLIEMTRQS